MTKNVAIKGCTVFVEKGGKLSAKFGSCANNPEAVRILETYDSDPIPH